METDLGILSARILIQFFNFFIFVFDTNIDTFFWHLVFEHY